MKLEIKNVTKQYGEVNAVNKVNCVMKKGIYGLLGVNGAGKTTLMRMLCTIVQSGRQSAADAVDGRGTFPAGIGTECAGRAAESGIYLEKEIV